MKRKTWRCDELSARRSMHFCGQVSQHERRQAWCCGLEPILESSGRRKVRLLPCFALQESVCWSETYFFESSMHFCGQVSSMSAVRLGVCGLEAHSREQRQAEKFVSYHVLRFKKAFCWVLKTYFREHDRADSFCRMYMFFTLRRTRSTEKLISTGLASGGIITLE